MYLYSSNEVCTYKYLNTCKYFEVSLSPFKPLCSYSSKSTKLNNQVHVEGNLESHSKKSKTLFSFMPMPETETTPFQSHSNTDDYLAAPHVSTDINPAKY